jgi:tetratricopeptide (TPR) repeat protein
MNFDRWRHYARGWLFHFLGRSGSAYRAYVDAFRADPRDAQSARHLAALAAGRERWEIAESWLENVVALQPESADDWFNLGFARDRAGKAEAAIAAFAEAVRRNPAQDRAWYGMGLVRARQGRHDDAAAALREAARLQPMNGIALYQLGMALHHAGRAGEVRAVVERLRDIEPPRAIKLVRDAGRADLLALVSAAPF